MAQNVFSSCTAVDFMDKVASVDLSEGHFQQTVRNFGEESLNDQSLASLITRSSSSISYYSYNFLSFTQPKSFDFSFQI